MDIVHKKSRKKKSKNLTIKQADLVPMLVIKDDEFINSFSLNDSFYESSKENDLSASNNMPMNNNNVSRKDIDVSSIRYKKPTIVTEMDSFIVEEIEQDVSMKVDSEFENTKEGIEMNNMLLEDEIVNTDRKKSNQRNFGKNRESIISNRNKRKDDRILKKNCYKNYRNEINELKKERRLSRRCKVTSYENIDCSDKRSESENDIKDDVTMEQEMELDDTQKSKKGKRKVNSTNNNYIEQDSNWTNKGDDSAGKKKTKSKKERVLNIDRFECASCKKMCTKRALNNHNCKKYDCDMCEMFFHMKRDLKVHRETHFVEGVNMCGICKKTFTGSGSLWRHMKTTHSKCMCGICKTVFMDIRDLNEHMKTHDEAFDLPEELGEHMLVSSTIDRFECDMCMELFSDRQQLNEHLESHVGVKRYKCRVCSTTFSRPYYYILHMAEHSEDNSYVCTECGAKFYERSEIWRHFQTHAFTYECETCKKSFKDTYHLRRHLRVHSRQINVY